MEELTREIATGRRNGVGGALLVLNMDRFSDINSALGHMVGDQLLRKIGHASSDGRLRDTDTLARIGGDEFGMILPGCGPEEAGRVATAIDRVGRCRRDRQCRRYRAPRGRVDRHGLLRPG